MLLCEGSQFSCELDHRYPLEDVVMMYSCLVLRVHTVKTSGY